MKKVEEDSRTEGLGLSRGKGRRGRGERWGQLVNEEREEKEGFDKERN